MSTDLQQAVFEELAALFDPVVVASADAASLAALLENLGWDVDAVFGPNGARFMQDVQAIARSVDTLRAWSTTPPATLADVGRGLTDAGKTIRAIQDLPRSAPSAPQTLADLPLELLEALLVRYLIVRAPTLFHVLVLLSLIEEREVPAIGANGVRLRSAKTLRRVRLDRVPDLVSDPVKTLRDVYAPKGIANQDDANATARVLFRRIAAVLQDLGIDAVVGRGASAPELPPEQEAILDGTFTASKSFVAGDARAEVGATFRLAAGTPTGVGLLIAPFGSLAIAEPFGGWLAELDVTGGVGAFVIRHGGVDIAPKDGSPPAEVDIGLQLTKLGAAGPAVMLGSARSTRLEIGELRLRADGKFTQARQDFGVLGEVGHAVFVVSGGEGDGFLAAVLPRDGLRVPFDLGIGWSTTQGFFFRGNASLTAEVPVHASLGRVASVDSVYLAIIARAATQQQTAGIDAIVAASATVRLGPLGASIARVGARLALSFPSGGHGNLGLVDASPQFKAPDGVGLSIDSAAVTGGGFLSFDEAQGQYAGALHLQIEGISLNAVGILSTKLPGGQEGFSLLIVISAAGFTPIQLGFGFSLTSVGGLLGINRDVSTPALQANLKSHALDSVLFSKENPVPRAAEIVRQLQTTFPPTADSFVFGPMAQLSWGTPTLLTIDVALLIRLPAPVRLFVLGRLRAFMPTEDKALVKLNMDVLGIVDFGAGSVSIDAVLYDSYILSFALTGGMALRAGWGSNPSFALAVGGFNPRFVAPKGFPQLERLALTLSAGDNPRLRVEAYLAVTSNTVQFGANADFRVVMGPVGVAGGFGFDALIQLAPFEFVVDIHASLALTYEGQMLMAVSVQVTLSGPAPLRARGSVSFTILFLTISKSFDVTLVPGAPPPGPAPIDVWKDQLQPALADARNWVAQLPESGQLVSIVASPPPAEGELLCHPLGTISIHQRAVPFERDLDRFGTRPLTGAKKFAVADVIVNGVTRGAALAKVYDQFAPAQFRQMSDNEKLKAPSFERMVAGVSVVDSAVATGAPVVKTLRYETKVARGDTRQPGKPFTPPAERVTPLAESGASAQAAPRATGRAKYRSAGLGVEIEPAEYVVATKSGLEQRARGDGTYSGAAEALRAYAAANPAEADDVQVVRKEELGRRAVPA